MAEECRHIEEVCKSNSGCHTLKYVDSLRFRPRTLITWLLIFSPGGLLAHHGTPREAVSTTANSILHNPRQGPIARY